MSQMALPPARDTNVDHQHIHNHIHSHPHNNGHHSHSSSTNSTLAAPDHAVKHNHRHLHHAHHHHARSPSQHSLPNNRPRSNSDTVVVIETVSVIQLIDAAGLTIALSTLPPSPPRTTTLSGTDLQLPTGSGVAPELPALPSGIEASLSIGVPTGPGNGVDTTPSLPPLDPTESPLESSMPATFPTLSYSPLTSTPLSGGPIFPTVGGVTNSTIQAVATPSASIPNNGTVSYSAFATLSPDTSSSADLTSPTLAATSSRDSDATSTTRPVTSSFATGTTTTSNGGTVPSWIGISDDGNTTPVATPQASNQSSSTTPPATIAGSVIGSIAGLAMILILALALLRYKRRCMEQSLESGATSRALAAGPGGFGGGYGAMSERPRSAPFAVPSTLAALTGLRRSRQSATPPSTPGTGERGFSKVSGRKLPPVIQFGGDGYSDPRDTMMTDASSGGVSYRDSTGIFANPNQRFAVGAPMRPESGIPVFHGGPSRSPRIDEGPFSDAGPYVRTDSPNLIPPTLDPLGRSHAGISQDGSNRSTLSASRFTENL